MPGEKHKSRHSEHAAEQPSQDGKSAKKQKKKKLEGEKKRKRKHIGDELMGEHDLLAKRDDVVADVIAPENGGKKATEGGEGTERTRLEDANESPLPAAEESRKKKKKKKKEKERKVDGRVDQAAGEDHSNQKTKSAEATGEKDLEKVEKPTKLSESPEPENKRKKKKKNRKSVNHTAEGDNEEHDITDGEVAKGKKGGLSENVVKSQEQPTGEPHITKETPSVDLTDSADVAKPKQNETSLDSVTKKSGKKRKRGAQGPDHSDHRPVKDSDKERQEANGENSATKRVKHGRNEATSRVNALDMESKSLPGDETTLSKSNSETASEAPVKESPQENSGDQEDAETPLDDKRLPRTLFVGNVPQTADRKDIRKIFAKFGSIESLRIRNVIPDNPKIPKKAALLAKRLASFSNSFSAYVVFKEVPNMDKVLQSAVKGTNMTIFQEHHLRVTKALQTKGKRRLSVFVGNLPFDCSDEELITTFMPIAEECGVNLLNVRVTRDKDTGVGRGVGFVAFDDMMAIKACMNKAGEITLRGRVLRIEQAFKSKMRKSKTYKRNNKAAKRRKK